MTTIGRKRQAALDATARQLANGLLWDVPARSHQLTEGGKRQRTRPPPVQTGEDQ